MALARPGSDLSVGYGPGAFDFLGEEEDDQLDLQENGMTLSARLRLFLATSIWGSSIEVVNMVLSGILFCFYIWETHYDTVNNPTAVVILAISAAFFARWLMNAFAAPKLGDFLSNPLNVIDLVSILPSVELLLQLMGIKLLEDEHLLIQLLRLLWMLRVFQLQGATAFLRSEIQVQLFTIFFTLLAITSLSAGILEVVENYEPLQPPPEYLPVSHLDGGLGFFNAFYLTIVTITTVGFGDIYPVTPPGRVTITLMIAVAFLVVTRDTNRLFTTLARQSVYVSRVYRPTPNSSHIIVCGAVGSKGAAGSSVVQEVSEPSAAGAGAVAFFKEFFNDDHGSVARTAVVLAKGPPSAELSVLMTQAKFNLGITYLDGDVMSPKDLRRCAVEQAKGVFVLSNKYAADAEMEDSSTILRALAVKRYVFELTGHDVMTCVQLIRPENRALFHTATSSFAGEPMVGQDDASLSQSTTNPQSRLARLRVLCTPGGASVAPDASPGPPQLHSTPSFYASPMASVRPPSTLSVCINEIKLNLLAQSCLCPGLPTMIYNLVASDNHDEAEKDSSGGGGGGGGADDKSPRDSRDRDGSGGTSMRTIGGGGGESSSNWRSEYDEGCSYEIYRIPLAPAFQGVTFAQACEILYEEIEVILFALELAPKELSQPRIALNPANFSIPSIMANSVHGFVIAEDKKAADIVSSVGSGRRRKSDRRRSRAPPSGRFGAAHASDDEHASVVNTQEAGGSFFTEGHGEKSRRGSDFDLGKDMSIAQALESEEDPSVRISFRLRDARNRNRMRKSGIMVAPSPFASPASRKFSFQKSGRSVVSRGPPPAGSDSGIPRARSALEGRHMSGAGSHGREGGGGVAAPSAVSVRSTGGGHAGTEAATSGRGQAAPRSTVAMEEGASGHSAHSHASGRPALPPDHRPTGGARPSALKKTTSQPSSGAPPARTDGSGGASVRGGSLPGSVAGPPSARDSHSSTPPEGAAEFPDVTPRSVRGSYLPSPMAGSGGGGAGSATTTAVGSRPGAGALTSEDLSGGRDHVRSVASGSVLGGDSDSSDGHEEVRKLAAEAARRRRRMHAKIMEDEVPARSLHSATIRTADKPGKGHPPLSNHVVVLGAGPDMDLYHFVKPLREGFLVDNPAVVILGKNPPTGRNWGKVSIFDDVFYLRGSAFQAGDLVRAGVERAASVILFTDASTAAAETDAPRGSDTLVDADSVCIYRLVRSVAPATEIIVEVAREDNIQFLSSRGRDPNALLTGPFVAGHVFSPAFLDILLCQAFFNPFIVTIVEQLLGGTKESADRAWRKRVQRRLGPLHESHSYLIPVPAKLVGKTFGELFTSFLRERGILALGIRRGVTAADLGEAEAKAAREKRRRQRKYFRSTRGIATATGPGGRGDRTSSRRGLGSPGSPVTRPDHGPVPRPAPFLAEAAPDRSYGNELPFTYTNPNKDSLLRACDAVYVLAQRSPLRTFINQDVIPEGSDDTLPRLARPEDVRRARFAVRAHASVRGKAEMFGGIAGKPALGGMKRVPSVGGRMVQTASPPGLAEMILEGSSEASSAEEEGSSSFGRRPAEQRSATVATAMESLHEATTVLASIRERRSSFSPQRVPFGAAPATSPFGAATLGDGGFGPSPTSTSPFGTAMGSPSAAEEDLQRLMQATTALSEATATLSKQVVQSDETAAEQARRRALDRDMAKAREIAPGGWGLGSGGAGPSHPPSGGVHVRPTAPVAGGPTRSHLAPFGPSHSIEGKESPDQDRYPAHMIQPRSSRPSEVDHILLPAEEHTSEARATTAAHGSSPTSGLSSSDSDDSETGSF